jgi:Tfp pilus assembly protein PilP
MVKMKTENFLRCALLSTVIALFACGETPPVQRSKPVSNTIAVQKVRQETTSSENKQLPVVNEGKANRAVVAPVEKAAALPIVPEQAGAAEPQAVSTPAQAAPAENKAETHGFALAEATPGLNGEGQISEQVLREDPAHLADVLPDQPSAGLEIALAASTLIEASVQLSGSYNAKDRFDPFEPLFKAQTTDVAVSAKSLREKRAPQTPLERVALSQLKVTAIIRSPSGNRALVEDATGKGYVVHRGTYIGLNAGRVVDIDKSRVVVEEEIENLMGELTLQNAELKLQKPAGEL